MLSDEQRLREKGWSKDRGMWIYKGDTFAAFTFAAAVLRQRAHDAAEAKKAEAETVMASIR